jgi:hypothetical protein
MIQCAETVPSVTRRFELWEEEERLVAYVTVALQGGVPCGIFIHAGTEGSLVGGLLRILGHETTWLLERGVPLLTLADLWGGQSFGPVGWQAPTPRSEAGYHHKSVLDAIGRWFKDRFPAGAGA